MAMLLHLCLCLVTVIQVTSSQGACDVTRQENEGVQIIVNNCGRSEQVLTNNDSSCCRRNEHVLGQLVMSVSRMEMTINGSSCERSEQVLSQLVTAVSRIEMITNGSSSCCGRSEQALGQLVTSVSEMQMAQQQDNNATQQALNQLMPSVSQIQTTNSQLVTSMSRMEMMISQQQQALNQLVTNVSQMQTVISQLQRDVAELKASNQETTVTGIRASRWKFNRQTFSLMSFSNEVKVTSSNTDAR